MYFVLFDSSYKHFCTTLPVTSNYPLLCSLISTLNHVIKNNNNKNSFCGFCGICSWSSLLSCYSQCKSKQPTPHQTLLIAIYTSITYTVLNKYNRRQRGKHDTGWANNNTVRPHLPLTLPPPVQVRGSNKDMYAPEPHSMRMSPTAYTVHGLYTYIYIMT